MNLVYSLLTIIACICALPVLGAIAMVIRITSGAPVVFAQRRVGKNGKPFIMYKFRTMVPDADTQKSKYLRRNESQGPAFKIRNDPRFTGIGKFLSHTGLDELPQLFNMLRGDMVLFGPRPLPTDEAARLKPWMRKRHAILPGIISPAILTGTYHKDFSQWMKSDIAYVSEKSLRTDVVLLVRYVPFVLRMFWRELRGS